MTVAPITSVELFGKDHWSTLAFVETRCVDYKGVLDQDKMRCNLNRHAAFAGPVQRRSLIMQWQENWGTRLSDGTMLSDHDDWDCLIDLAKVGYIEIIDIDSAVVKMTPAGLEVVQKLRIYRTETGRYTDFRPQ